MKAMRIVLVILLAVGLTACESRTDRTDGGGVLLSISDFDELPISVSVNSAGTVVQVGEVTLSNVVKDPDLAPSSLMNIEIRSYEITFSRGDTGTRLPPKYVEGLFGVVPAGGTTVYNNLPILGPDQLRNPPLSDLLFQNGGFDKETNDTKIILNLHLRFFGRTLSGDAVASEPANFTLSIFP